MSKPDCAPNPIIGLRVPIVYEIVRPMERYELIDTEAGPMEVNNLRGHFYWADCVTNETFKPILLCFDNPQEVSEMVKQALLLLL